MEGGRRLSREKHTDADTRECSRRGDTDRDPAQIHSHQQTRAWACGSHVGTVPPSAAGPRGPWTRWRGREGCFPGGGRTRRLLWVQGLRTTRDIPSEGLQRPLLFGWDERKNRL